MFEQDELLKLDNQFCFAVYSINLSLNQTYRKLLSPWGLTYPQYLVLLVLWEEDHLTVSSIGKRLFLESSTLTPLLKRLESLKWLVRHRSKQDERQVVVSLTEEGIQLKEKMKDIPHQIQCASDCDLQTMIEIKQQLNAVRDKLNQK
ncbi:MarR family winged helix-turn-helix transcriptional regulator [Acinetobacter nectaris]|uniref:HTH marR-type domain-containing protein n=1 Tax=Acinetobacter nectaris CIP 110549 TaxID=1392540 RepID=V2TZ42_9GAMM|nr:MarR family transcriptional regulator [Acinetobacter nectaris]ESK41105.1 hypothetical protein P256_00090 [Acinetobacter nectaris CIP 110549]MCF8998934.1 MarR family transcriptional regulator [Acinetobacter nectaris]MCF9027473.1 MarR family transcriptional regulator [Acinetobacter nectaris]MCF9034577.1 MarR family transcriptional regulator [Acinetobacter nectaris]MCF9046217.1 MarR family transcriptional regulator [Acinetobacter nectaris]